MVDDATLRLGLDRTLMATAFDGLGERYEGKVRDNYSNQGVRTIVVTDRISAFDRNLGTLPFKGQLLNSLASWWFEETRAVAPNHLIGTPDPNVMVAVECEPLPVEFVVRGYLTGVTSTSIWTHYSRGERSFAGHSLPDGLSKHAKLPSPLLTPSTKAPKGGHDMTVSRSDIVSSGAVSARDFDEAADMAMALFAFGQKTCAGHGLILVDTKYEFGRNRDGQLVVIDEIHTPDSSRFWYASSYDEHNETGEEPESFDKEYVRRFLASQGYLGEGPPPKLPAHVRVEASRRYIEAWEAIRGESFIPDVDPPLPRIRANLERSTR